MVSRRHSPARAFTLLELLVVVAIVALLMAILLPSLSRARELSKRTVGASRLRAIGQMCAVYANEWDDKLPICLRAVYPGAISGSGTGGTTFIPEYIQKAVLSTTGNKQVWQWGVPIVLSSPSGGSFNPQSQFGDSKVWVSSGSDCQNIFDLPLYGAAVNGPLWQYLAGKGPGGTKCFGYGSYFTFIGDPGNSTTNKVYYQDSALINEDPRFDENGGSQGRLSKIPSSQIFMQDIVLQDAAAVGGFFCANYLTNPGGYLVNSYGCTGSDPLGTAMGLGSGAHAYVAGYYNVSSESDIAGGNTLYADGSAVWVKIGSMTRMYYKSPASGNIRTLYLGVQ